MPKSLVLFQEASGVVPGKTTQHRTLLTNKFHLTPPLQNAINVAIVHFVSASGAHPCMCGCVKEMPEVSRADYTTYDDDNALLAFAACTDNDLSTRFQEEYPNIELNNLVDNCDN